LKHIVPVIIDAFVLQTFYSTWIQGVAYQKQLLGPKLTGAGLGSIQKCGNPYFSQQPLKLATSNLVYNLGLGSSFPRNNF